MECLAGKSRDLFGMTWPGKVRCVTSVDHRDGEFLALEEIHAAALRNLPRDAATYLESGSGTQLTLRANRQAGAPDASQSSNVTEPSRAPSPGSMTSPAMSGPKAPRQVGMSLICCPLAA
jgi:hypothetical protein